MLMVLVIPAHVYFLLSLNFVYSTEFSDQNFVEDNPGGKPSRKSRSKRLKTAATDGSSKHQVINISHET